MPKPKRVFYDVEPHPKGGWQGKAEGGSRAVVRGPTKAAVQKETIAIAKRQPVASVRIKGRNGRVQEERTYPRSTDRNPPKG